MTNANTPTTREREAARELSVDIVYRLKSDNVIWNEMAMDVIVPRIAAALARERREAWNEACEKCAGECVDHNDSESCRKLKLSDGEKG